MRWPRVHGMMEKILLTRDVRLESLTYLEQIASSSSAEPPWPPVVTRESTKPIGLTAATKTSPGSSENWEGRVEWSLKSQI